VAGGPHVEPYLKVLQSYADAGFDTLHVSQIGPDQAGLLPVLDPMRSLPGGGSGLARRPRPPRRGESGRVRRAATPRRGRRSARLSGPALAAGAAGTTALNAAHLPRHGCAPRGRRAPPPRSRSAGWRMPWARRSSRSRRRNRRPTGAPA
jgi:hypothetical protein